MQKDEELCDALARTELNDGALLLSRKANQKLEDFISAYPPSKTTSKTCDWIQCGGRQCVCSDWNRVIEPCSAVLNTCRKNYDHFRCAELLEKFNDVARKHNATQGKWLLEIPRQVVDKVWSSIASRSELGYLGIGAKISPMPEDPEDCHVLCVETDNYLDSRDTRRVLLELRNMGLKRFVLGYTADIFAVLGFVCGKNCQEQYEGMCIPQWTWSRTGLPAHPSSIRSHEDGTSSISSTASHADAAQQEQTGGDTQTSPSSISDKSESEEWYFV